MKIKKQGETSIPNEKVQDLRISDYMVDVEATPDMSFRDALILAMKREKAAYRLYTNLAYLASRDEVRNMFQSLAREEAKHKLRFEIEYDEKIYGEN
jgi:rubrerythrin